LAGSRSIFLAAQIYRDGYVSANNYESASDGEYALIRRLSNEKVTTIFDVGANDGSYSKMISKILGEAKIFAFELSPITFSRLQDNVRHDTKIILVDAGLSNTEAEVAFHHVDENPSLSGLGSRPYSVESRVLKSRVIRGDVYAKHAGIESIDFVKIDVEGFEIEVIEGLSGILDSVQIVQFEYNEMSWMRGNFLDKFREVLPGFQIGRLTQGGVIWDLSLLSNAHLCAGNMIALNSRYGVLKALLSRF
jgi:FkbM family methyltransferase